MLGLALVVVHFHRLRLPAWPGMVHPVVVALAMVCFLVLVVAVPESLVVLPVVPLFDSVVQVWAIGYVSRAVDVALLTSSVLVPVGRSMNIPSVAVTVVACRNIPVVVVRILLLRPLFVVRLCRGIVEVCSVKVVAIYIVLFRGRCVLYCSGTLSRKSVRRNWIFVDFPAM